MQCLLYGNGSGNRDFRILNGLTEPTNPREGDIWLKTEEEITGYTITGYTMDDLTELETKGHVYIGGGKRGGRNGGKAEILLAARMGEIKIIPFRWCIFNGSIWVVPEMEVYQKGQWVDAGLGWDGELYWDGEQYEMFTGGWTIRNRNKQGDGRPSDWLQDTSCEDVTVGNGLGIDVDLMCIATKNKVYIPKGKQYLCVEGHSYAYDKNGYIDDGKGWIGFFVDQGIESDDERYSREFSISGKFKLIIHTDGTGNVYPGYRWGIRFHPPYVANKTNEIEISRVWLE